MHARAEKPREPERHRCEDPLIFPRLNLLDLLVPRFKLLQLSLHCELGAVELVDLVPQNRVLKELRLPAESGFQLLGRYCFLLLHFLEQIVVHDGDRVCGVVRHAEVLALGVTVVGDVL